MQADEEKISKHWGKNFSTIKRQLQLAKRGDRPIFLSQQPNNFNARALFDIQIYSGENNVYGRKMKF